MQNGDKVININDDTRGKERESICIITKSKISIELYRPKRAEVYFHNWKFSPGNRNLLRNCHLVPSW